MKTIQIGTDVMTQHGLGTIISVDSTTYSIAIYTIRLDADTSIAITRSAFSLKPVPEVNRQIHSI